MEFTIKGFKFYYYYFLHGVFSIEFDCLVSMFFKTSSISCIQLTVNFMIWAKINFTSFVFLLGGISGH